MFQLRNTLANKQIFLSSVVLMRSLKTKFKNILTEKCTDQETKNYPNNEFKID